MIRDGRKDSKGNGAKDFPTSKSCPECGNRNSLKVSVDGDRRRTVKTCRICRMNYVHDWR